MLTHKGTQILYTDRLILRKFTVDDAEDMYFNWANDERVTRFLTWQPHETVDFTRQMLEGWDGAYDNIKTYNWVIEYDKKAIGNISVIKISDKCEYAELGYVLGYDYWNKGIISEAAIAVVDYLFCSVVPFAFSAQQLSVFLLCVVYQTVSIHILFYRLLFQ